MHMGELIRLGKEVRFQHRICLSTIPPSISGLRKPYPRTVKEKEITSREVFLNISYVQIKQFSLPMSRYLISLDDKTVTKHIYDSITRHLLILQGQNNHGLKMKS